MFESKTEPQKMTRTHLFMLLTGTLQGTMEHRNELKVFPSQVGFFHGLVTSEARIKGTHTHTRSAAATDFQQN